jgi:hypothetical protein
MSACSLPVLPTMSSLIFSSLLSSLFKLLLKAPHVNSKEGWTMEGPQHPERLCACSFFSLCSLSARQRHGT